MIGRKDNWHHGYRCGVSNRYTPTVFALAVVCSDDRTHGDPGANGYASSDRHGDPSTHGHPYRDCNDCASLSHGYHTPNRDAEATHGDAGPNGDTYAQTYENAHADGDPHTNEYADCDSDSHSYSIRSGRRDRRDALPGHPFAVAGGRGRNQLRHVDLDRHQRANTSGRGGNRRRHLRRGR